MASGAFSATSLRSGVCRAMCLPYADSEVFLGWLLVYPQLCDSVWEEVHDEFSPIQLIYQLFRQPAAPEGVGSSTACSSQPRHLAVKSAAGLFFITGLDGQVSSSAWHCETHQRDWGFLPSNRKLCLIFWFSYPMHIGEMVSR